MTAILLIEKDEVTLEIYQRELSNSFTVFSFTELNTVMDTITQENINVVVIEPEVNEGQGWEFVNTIHQILPGRSIPVIVCSTRDATKNHKGKNIALYLTKPVLPKTLREKILEVLGLPKTRR